MSYPRRILAKLKHAVQSRVPGAAPDPETATGLDLNPIYDRLTSEIIRAHVAPGTIAIDVGANVGGIVAELVSHAPSARHLAFEPIPHLAAKVRATYPSVSVHEVALAAEAGELEFHHVRDLPDYSGLRQRTYPDGVGDVELITVAVRRLDDVIAEDAAGETISLIKIDVEGAELGVLQGGRQTIETHRPLVVFEHGVGGANHYGTEPEHVWDFFAEIGFGLSTLQAFTSGGAPLTRDEMHEQYHRGTNYYFIAHPPTT